MGASGCRIIEVGDDYVIKIDSRRGLEQAEWLTKNASPGVVKVLSYWSNGYVMERLAHGPCDVADLIGVLAKFVWPRPPSRTTNWDQIIGYAQLRCDDWWPEARDDLMLGFNYIKNRNLSRCLTHGDPTIENLMMRGETPVLIDPLPARDYVPDLLAVDLGKILQSWYGYEAIRSQIVPAEYEYPEWLDRFSDEDARAAWVFLIFHVVRLLPYQPTDMIRSKIKEHFGEHLFRLRPR